MNTKFDEEDQEYDGITKEVERYIFDKHKELMKKFDKNEKSFYDIKTNQRELKGLVGSVMQSLKDL